MAPMRKPGWTNCAGTSSASIARVGRSSGSGRRPPCCRNAGTPARSASTVTPPARRRPMGSASTPSLAARVCWLMISPAANCGGASWAKDSIHGGPGPALPFTRTWSWSMPRWNAVRWSPWTARVARKSGARRWTAIAGRLPSWWTCPAASTRSCSAVMRRFTVSTPTRGRSCGTVKRLPGPRPARLRWCAATWFT